MNLWNWVQVCAWPHPLFRPSLKFVCFYWCQQRQSTNGMFSPFLRSGPGAHNTPSVNFPNLTTPPPYKSHMWNTLSKNPPKLQNTILTNPHIYNTSKYKPPHFNNIPNTNHPILTTYHTYNPHYHETHIYTPISTNPLFIDIFWTVFKVIFYTFPL